MTPRGSSLACVGIGSSRWFLNALFWLAAGLSPAHAQSTDVDETQIKAAYLFKFTDYVEWPPDAFATIDAPLVIGVMGADPIAEELKLLVEGQTVNRRAVQVRQVGTAAAMDGPLHILLIGDADRAQLDRVLARVRGEPVLVVSSNRIANAPGVMINFLTVKRRVRFEVRLRPVAEARIRLSALMLSVAHRVEKDRQ